MCEHFCWYADRSVVCSDEVPCKYMPFVDTRAQHASLVPRLCGLGMRLHIVHC